MNAPKLLIILIFLFSFFYFGESFAKNDLTRQKPIEVEVFLNGKIGETHFYYPSTLNFETGKLYKLKIKNVMIANTIHLRISNVCLARKLGC